MGPCSDTDTDTLNRLWMRGRWVPGSEVGAICLDRPEMALIVLARPVAVYGLGPTWKKCSFGEICSEMYLVHMF